MNFLQISLTSKCNLACEHCPMAMFRNTDDAEHVLTLQRLAPWLEAYIKPEEWIIELTGGEPALFKDIDPLCQWLSERHYNVLIKTNGLLEIRRYPNIMRISAFHQLDNPPKYWDRILIVDRIQREEKERYCIEHGWPYKVIGYNKENPDNAIHQFDLIGFMDPHGHETYCPSMPIRWKKGDDPFTIERRRPLFKKCCPHCKAAIDAWRFLPEELKMAKSR